MWFSVHWEIPEMVAMRAARRMVSLFSNSTRYVTVQCIDVNLLDLIRVMLE